MREDFAVLQVQGVRLLLQGMPNAELETPQACLFDGSIPTTLRAGGNGDRTSFGKATTDQSTHGSDVLHLP